MNPLVLADYGRATSASSGWRSASTPRLPGTRPTPGGWTRRPFATWIRRTARTKTAREALTTGIRAVFAVEPADLSLLHVLFYAAAAGGWDDLIDTEGGAQQDRIVGGSQLISLRMAERLGDRVRLDVACDASPPTERASSSATFSARRVIVALPPGARGPARLRAAAPGRPRPAHPTNPDGHRDQVHGGLRRALLARGRPLRPGAEPARPRAGDLRQHSAERRARGVLGLPRGRRRPAAWAPPPRRERREVVVGTFARCSARAPPRPPATSRRTGAREPYSRGCYARRAGPGAWTSFGRALREPVGRIHWAGTETATRWMGYFDGAIQAGRRAAAEVIAAEGAGPMRRPRRRTAPAAGASARARGASSMSPTSRRTRASSTAPALVREGEVGLADREPLSATSAPGGRGPSAARPGPRPPRRCRWRHRSPGPACRGRGCRRRAARPSRSRS